MKNMNDKQILKRVRGVDLNLLTVFEAIFNCKSVSLAAKMLNISPSAVSQSLQKYVIIMMTFYSFVREMFCNLR